MAEQHANPAEQSLQENGVFLETTEQSFLE